MPQSRNIMLVLSFDGTAYHGWQVQRNAVTVQQTLQDALQKILKTPAGVNGCSRTDAGVHARRFVCNFHAVASIPCENLLAALNANLPHDISVKTCREVPDDFHARYSAKGKEYIYRILASPVRDPFCRNYALHYPYPLDTSLLADAAREFLGPHDFASFCAAGSSVRDTVRTVSLFKVEREGGQVLFRVRADGFLYNMVRIMAGTLLYVAQGKIQPGEIKSILAARDRSFAGPTAPAHALFLNRVFYEGEDGTDE